MLFVHDPYDKKTSLTCEIEMEILNSDKVSCCLLTPSPIEYALNACHKLAPFFSVGRVIMACRDEASAQEAIADIKAIDSTADITFRRLDLTSLNSVEQFAERICKGRAGLLYFHSYILF